MLTIGERDDCVSNMLNEIQNFWNKTDIEEMLRMTKDDMISRLRDIAAEYSDNHITITICEDSVSFEKMDERSMKFE